jgi:membrane-associated phospholipid phosphatase
MITFFGVVLYTSFIFMLIKFIDYPLAQYMKFHCYEEIRNLFHAITDFVKSTYWIICSIVLYFFIIFKNSFCLKTFTKFFKRENFQIFISKTALSIYLSVLFSGIFVNLLKPIFGRIRPYFSFSSGENGFQFFQFGSSFASFPSGHSATALAIATVFALSFPKWRIYFFGAGLLFAFSRVVTSNHYLSDVFVGGTIGILTAIYFNRRLHAIF